VYYYNSDTKESSWEHPTDSYYRFMYKKVRKMRRQRHLAAGGTGGVGGSYSTFQREEVYIYFCVCVCVWVCVCVCDIICLGGLGGLGG
jgi:hypothetical protein